MPAGLFDASALAVIENLERRIREDPTADEEERLQTLGKLENFTRQAGIGGPASGSRRCSRRL